MKVLMLGWEFPPHITGGLATACLGLCEGLAGTDAQVTFVTPRAFGDEDQRFARVIGANQVWIESEDAAATPARPRATATLDAAEARSGSTAGAAHPTTPSSDEPRSAPEPAPRRPSFVERDPSDAPPSAYFDAQQYARWVARLEGALTSSQDAAAPARGRADSRAGAPRAEATGAARRDEPSEPMAEAPPRPPRLERFEFRGEYGADLFDEVSRYARCVAQIVANERFDLIHAHDWMTFPAGVLAARSARLPLVAHVHASEYDRSGDHPNERIRALEQLGVDAADRVVCVSHYTAGILRTRYGVDEARLRVVHNAVTRTEQSARLRAAKTIEEPIVLFLGRITFQKGPDYFLEAAQRVVQVEPNVKFVMVGAGDMLPRMVERAARLGLARHVHFTGFLRGAEVERIYSMADVYVMPSVSEPFGISPLEALALDTPVIVSRQSGVSEVLANALKVDFWDIDEIANKILALLRFPALREHVRVAGGGEVRAMSWADRGKRLHEVYAELVG